MQREIKFRGKIVDNGEWVFGSLVQDNHPEIKKSFIHYNDLNDLFERFSVEIIPETVGQFTGLTDKNGKEIYEGDICDYEDNKLMSNWTRGERFLVVSLPGRFSARMKPFDKYNGCNQNTLNEEFKDCCQIIGNIHDSQELLK